MLKRLLLILGLLVFSFVAGTAVTGTDSPDAGEIDLYERAANGSYYVGHKAPDALAATVVWTDPPADAAGFWKSDGAGHLSIVAIPAMMSASLVTTRAASDKVTVPGVTSKGHCLLTATNAAAATYIAGTYVSAKTTNQITVAHRAISGMSYDILCSPN